MKEEINQTKSKSQSKVEKRKPQINQIRWKILWKSLAICFSQLSHCTQNFLFTHIITIIFFFISSPVGINDKTEFFLYKNGEKKICFCSTFLYLSHSRWTKNKMKNKIRNEKRKWLIGIINTKTWKTNYYIIIIINTTW